MGPTTNGNVKKGMRLEKKMHNGGKINKRNDFIRKDQGKNMKMILKEKGTKDSMVQATKIANKKKKTYKKKKEQIHLEGNDETVEVKPEHMDDSDDNNVEIPPSVDDPMKESFLSDSIKDGKDAFAWLIAPIKPDEFFKTVWEKAPLLVTRSKFPDYFKALFSSQKIHEILRNDYVLFSKNLDVTSYVKGERRTLNPSGRATPAVVWDFYRKGCSVRMLNPQTFCPELRKLNATLQEFFGCFVGANSYLTPANSQGFAPHYDDIEAFILQIEGRKHWKVYSPRKPDEVLPRFSSGNFSQEELGTPVLEVTLHPGDLLYFPRGFIHQAKTDPDAHSLHITISCFQRNTWGDFLEKLLPAAVSMAQEEDVSFRKGLPRDYLLHLGVSHCDRGTDRRRLLLEQTHKLVMKLTNYLPVDATADQMAKQFMHDALPPMLTEEEENCTVFSGNNVTLKERGEVSGTLGLTESSRIRLLRSHLFRLVKEDGDDDLVQVYHCIDNSLEYHGEEPQSFDVNSEFALAMDRLLHLYPEFIAVGELPLDRLNDKLELANLLWKKGLVMTSSPLNVP